MAMKHSGKMKRIVIKPSHVDDRGQCGSRRNWRSAFLTLLTILLAHLLQAQVSVTTYQYNSQRTGVNGSETILTPSNVNSTNFGKLFSQAVDGNIYAQPLYMPSLTINGAVHNVVFVATENDSVYAFDADSNTGANAQPLWQTSLIPPGGTTVSDNYCTDINPQYGITGTPVIDPSTNILYAVGETYENGNYIKRLHALNIITGTEMPGSPTVITATVTVPGQGAVTFDSLWENQRAGLLFYNGVVYIGFGSHCDGSTWQGWILGYSYNNSSLNQVFVFSTEPSSINGTGGGIWMSGQGLPMDTGSNLFVGTGNGYLDTNDTPPLDYGDSVIRLDLSQGPTVQDYFSPGVQSILDIDNQDLGSGGIAILPPQPGPYPDLLVTADKYQTIYLLNRDNLGQYNATSDDVVQELNGAVGRMFSSPIYFNGQVYFWGASDVLKAFTITNGMLTTSATDEGPDLFHFPGGVPTISANGTSNAILWALRSDGFSSGAPAVLYAYVPGNLSAGSIYNSNQNLGRDNPGGAIKFAVPIVANGKVYVGTVSQLSVYGELTPTAPTVTSGNSTTFTAGTAGSFTITAVGTPTPSFGEGGALPSGVTFVDNGNGTAKLGGTPASGTAGSYPITITASNNAGTAIQGFTLSVTNVLGTAPTITSSSSTAFTVGETESFTITTTGTPTPVLSESGTLPSGVTFVDNGNGTGTLGGTGASGTAGDYSITITASNNAGTAIQSFILTENSSGGGGSGSWGQMDLWLQMNTSTPGTTLTTDILAAGSVGGVLASNNFGEAGVAGTPSGNADIVLATPFVTGSDSRGYAPVSVSGYNGAVSATASFDLGIYSDNSGSPGTLLCHTGTTSLTPGVWNFITVSLANSSCPMLGASTQYWSAYITNSNSIGQSYVMGVCPGTSLSSVESSSLQGGALLPNSFGASAAFSSECYSLYVTADDNSGTLTWNLDANPPTGFTIGASQGSLGGSVTVNGTNYPNGTPTQSLALDNGASVPLYASTTSSFVTGSGALIPSVVTNGYLTPGPANAGGNGVNFGLVTVVARNGDYVTLELNSGNGDGSGQCYCVKLETNGGSGGNTIYSSNVALTPGHRYSFSLLFDETGGTAKLAMFDPSNGFAQVGSIVTAAQTTGGSLGELWLGNSEDGTSSGNTTYFEDIMLDWTNHVFPNSPGVNGSTTPAITSVNSTSFTVGTAGAFTVTTTGSPTPSLSESGALPGGVIFVDNGNGTGALGGTPNSGTAGSYPLTITAGNSIGTANQSFTLTVNTASTAPAITSASGATFTVGTAGSFTITTTGTPSPSLSESGTLPSGVTFVNNANGTATLSGTPASGTGGSYSLTITASNGVGTAASQTFTLTVSQAPAITSGSGATFTVGTAGSFTVTTTGTPTPSLSESGTLPSGMTFVDNGNGMGTLAGTAASGTMGSYPLTITASNGVGTAATQSFMLTVSGGGTTNCASPTSVGSYTFCNEAYNDVSSGTTSSVSFDPSVGNGIEVFVQYCGNSACNAAPTQTATIGDNVNSPETCFTLSPHSPYSLSNTFVPDYEMLYAWYCPSIPAGVTTFTVTTDATAYYLQIDAIEWKAGSIVSSNYFETVDQIVNSGDTAGTMASVSTSGPTVNANDLITATIATCGASIPGVVGTGYTGIIVNPAITPGHITEAAAATSTGIKTATTTWSSGSAPESCSLGGTGSDDTWFGVIVPLIGSAAPAITSVSSTTFAVGTAGIFTVTTTGAPTPSLSEGGALPTGVTFVDKGNGTATLSGTAASGTAGSYPITITASNSAGTANQSFTLTVNNGSTAPTITSASSTIFIVGTAESFTVTTNGTPTPTLSETGALPIGVTFVDNGNGTGTLNGTAASGTAGSYSITITASNSAGTANQSFTLTVNQAPAITSSNNTTFTVGTVGSFVITTTGMPTPSLSESGTLPGGVSFTNNGNGTATLSGTPSTGSGGTYPLSITATNSVGTASQSFTLTVDQSPAITSASSTTFVVGTAGSFTVTTTGTPAPTLSKVGTLPSSVTFTNNGNGTATLSGTPTGIGSFSITIRASNGVGTSATQKFTLIIDKVPAITSAKTTTFDVGSAGTFTVTTTGMPTPSLSEIGALPSGAAFQDNGNGTGTLSGTPAAGSGGSYPITFTATNSVGTASQSFTLRVDQPPAITSTNSTTFTAGTDGSFTVTASGTPAPSLTKTGTLPSGVSFTNNKNGTATLTGTPGAKTGGTYTITITATNSTGTATQSFTLTVNQAPVITSAKSATFTVGTAESFTVTTAAMPTPSLIETGTLPSGVTFFDNGNGTATLGGTPASGTNGKYPITITARNSIGTTSQSFTLTIN